MPQSRALVILSGGQDSTTCLFIAKSTHSEVHSLTFDYAQRHRLELGAARKVAQLANVVSHEVLELQGLLKSTSPLVDHKAVVGHYATAADMPGGVEPTFVPGRNALFLLLAANRALAMGTPYPEIFVGISQEDFGGYPDCRGVFLDAMSNALSLGLFGKLHVLTITAPLLYLSKVETCLLARELPGCLDALAYSHTCYDGSYPPNPYNHASILRARGFRGASMPDPLIVRAKREGLLRADYPDDGLLVS